MNALNIERINSRAPYKVWTTSRDNEYNFITEANVLYGVAFTEEMLIGNVQSYQFSFARLNAKHTEFDEKIRQTLFAIIDEFFNAHNEIMIYICDTSDGREAFRSKLFLKWFENSESSERFVIRTASAVIDGQGFYTAMIVEKLNAHIEEILSDFDETANVLCEK